MASFNIGTSMMHPTLMHNDSDDGDNIVQENNDADDDSDGSDNVLKENSMQVAAQGVEDDIKQVEDAYANNEYAEPKDPHPSDFEDDGWVNSTYMKNITAEFNRFTIPTATDDLKVGIYLNQKLNYSKQLLSGPLNMDCHSRL